MKPKILISWSSGKDSAWVLHTLRQDPDVHVAGLFCTVNREFDRVAMHGVRTELLRRQAENASLPLEIVELPHPCSNEQYEKAMGRFVEKARTEEIEYFAFGDLFLEDVRRYREEKLDGCGIKPIFPIWGMPTDRLAEDMIVGGLKAVTTCVDPKQIPEEFVGREFDRGFLGALPETADPCGENGEFHSFVFDGPMFNAPIKISIGGIVRRDGFVFADILPAARCKNN